MAAKGWQTPFFEPIRVPKGKPLRTLHDARAYVMALSKAEQRSEPWQAAVQAMLIGAECGATSMAEIGIRSAINGPRPEPNFTRPGRDAKGWRSYSRRKDPWR